MHGNFVRRISLVLSSSLVLLSASFPARAESVSASDLEGLAVEVNIVRDQIMQRQGRTFSARVHQNWSVAIRAGSTVDLTVDSSVDSPYGMLKYKPNSGTFTIDQLRRVNSRGGGEAVWKFSDSTLTFMRTFIAGAYRMRIVFSRGPAGLTCTAAGALARENGNGTIRLNGAFGDELTVVSANPVSSSCTIVRKKA